MREGRGGCGAQGGGMGGGRALCIFGDGAVGGGGHPPTAGRSCRPPPPRGSHPPADQPPNRGLPSGPSEGGPNFDSPFPRRCSPSFAMPFPPPGPHTKCKPNRLRQHKCPTPHVTSVVPLDLRLPPPQPQFDDPSFWGGGMALRGNTNEGDGPTGPQDTGRTRR